MRLVVSGFSRLKFPVAFPSRAAAFKFSGAPHLAVGSSVGPVWLQAAKKSPGIAVLSHKRKMLGRGEARVTTLLVGKGGSVWQARTVHWRLSVCPVQPRCGNERGGMRRGGSRGGFLSQIVFYKKKSSLCMTPPLMLLLIQWVFRDQQEMAPSTGTLATAF